MDSIDDVSTEDLLREATEDIKRTEERRASMSSQRPGSRNTPTREPPNNEERRASMSSQRPGSNNTPREPSTNEERRASMSSQRRGSVSTPKEPSNEDKNEERRASMSSQKRGSSVSTPREPIINEAKNEERRASISSQKRGSSVSTPREPIINEAKNEERRASISSQKRGSSVNTPREPIINENKNEERSQSISSQKRNSISEQNRSSFSQDRPESLPQGKEDDNNASGNKTRRESIVKQGTDGRETIIREDSPEIPKDIGSENSNKEDAHIVRENAANAPAKDLAKEPEGMPNIEDAGTGQFVDDALEKQRQSERAAFQKLIDENAKLENELNKTRDELQDAISKRDMFYGELEQVRSQITEKHAKICELENDLLLLDTKPGDQTVHGEGKKNTEEGEGSEKEVLESKVRDLQLRLKRMVKDAEVKDEGIREDKRQLRSLEGVIEKLEPHMDKEKFEEIMAAKNGHSEDQDDEIDIGPGNVVRGETAPKSSICVIQ